MREKEKVQPQQWSYEPCEVGFKKRENSSSVYQRIVIIVKEERSRYYQGSRISGWLAAQAPPVLLQMQFQTPSAPSRAGA